MFELESRKQHTKSVVQIFKDTLYKINPDHKINGLGVLIFHWIFVAIPLLCLFLCELGVKFYLSVITWIIIFSLHFLHKGCIFTRIERELWGCDDWYGPWVLPFYILERVDIEITPMVANSIFLSWGVFIILWIIARVAFSVKALV